jgi:hypothetical protein
MSTSRNKSFGELQKMVQDLGGHWHSQFIDRYEEWSVIIVVPKVKKEFWGFGKTEEDAYRDSVRQFELLI